MDIERARSFSIVGPGGIRREYEILMTFRWEKTGRQYIVFQDDTTDDEGHAIVFTAAYEVDPAGRISLSDVNDEEATMISALLEKVENSFQEDGEEQPESLHFEL